MSVSALIGRDHVPAVEALLSVLEEHVSLWRMSTTLEERLLIESQAVRLFEDLLSYDVSEISEVSAGDYPELGEMGDTYSVYRSLVKINIVKLQKLGELFLEHFNSQQMALQSLLGTMKRIKQKQASLALWDDAEVKYVIADRFLNMDWVDTAFTSVTEANVDTAQGLLTLPVQSRTDVAILSARIGSGSNGNPGNSDTAVTTHDLNPEYAINEDPNNWFEYERLDNGPLTLTYVIELAKPEIVNYLSLQSINLDNSYAYEIEDITFTASGTETKSIKDLVSASFDKEFFTVKSLQADTAFNVTFLPVVAQSISVKLIQRTPHQVAVFTSDGREVLRDRYAIGIKRISLARLEFAGVGGINSSELTVPSGLYAALPVVDVWPANPELFDMKIEVSRDGGENWKASGNLDDGVGSTVLLDGQESSIMWRVRMDRDDDALSTLTSFTASESLVKDVKASLRSVSRFQSPANVPLSVKPQTASVFALQPKIGRRGDKFSSVVLGRGTGTATSFELPFDFISLGLQPEEMTVYVDRTEMTYQTDNLAIGAGEWAFSDDFSEIQFSDDLGSGSEVSCSFEEELMQFEERADGYYHTAKFLFDPDKDNIAIRSLPRAATRKSLIIPRDKKVISLGYKMIRSDNFSITDDAGTSYTERTVRADLALSTDYFVDYANGILFLGAEIGTAAARISFEHSTPIDLSDKEFDVFYRGLRPSGMRISKSAFQATEVTDLVGGSMSSRIDVVTGLYGARTDVFSSATNAQTLSYKSVVKGTLKVDNDLLGSTTVIPAEVPYIDGRTEFLGLVPMDTEETVELTNGGLPYVTFKLAAGALWYQDFDVAFDGSVYFVNKQANATLAQAGVVGHYHIAEDGTVTVSVAAPGAALPAGIKMNYYYQDPSFDPSNKYSVDYANGVLYSSTDLNAGATLTYKASSYKTAYNIAAEVDSYDYDKKTNTVSVRTEGLKSINSLVKVLWEENNGEESLATLAPFFSPLVSVLAFRCS